MDQKQFDTSSIFYFTKINNFALVIQYNCTILILLKFNYQHNEHNILHCGYIVHCVCSAACCGRSCVPSLALDRGYSIVPDRSGTFAKSKLVHMRFETSKINNNKRTKKKSPYAVHSCIFLYIIVCHLCVMHGCERVISSRCHQMADISKVVL